MKVFVKGQGEVTLTQQHFVATGGQASVYVRDGFAYKVYTDPNDAIPQDKFTALAKITDPYVIRPSDPLLETKRSTSMIGYRMAAVPDNLSLCQLFTKAFRERNHVTNDHIVDLSGKLRGHVSNVHAAGVVIVDLNELNILVPKTFDETFLIDVDSYQTSGYQATVIMPSVRDWSAKAFTELSDWFSYAVLAFQLYIGCHPYKGTLASVAGVPKDRQLEHRMRNNLSAFRSDVRLPKCCYPLDAIPQTFREWLRAVLDDGKRVAPPDPKGGPVAALVTTMRALASTGKLAIQEIMSCDGWDLGAWAESGLMMLALVRKQNDVNILLNGVTVQALRGKGIHDVLSRGQTLLGFTPKFDRPVALNLHAGQLTFVDLEAGTSEVLAVRADELARSGDRLYVRNGTRVVEVEFHEVVRGRVIVIASHCVADVLEMASRLYEGCAVQNMLGSVFVSLFPRSRAGYQVRIPELDAYKILDAKFDGGVLMVVGAKGGKYDRLVFRFDPDFTTYDLRTVSDVLPTGLNFITLSTGICVAMTEEETLEAFSARKGAAGIRVVEDPALGNDMRLTKVGGKAGFTRGDRVYQVSLK